MVSLIAAEMLAWSLFSSLIKHVPLKGTRRGVVNFFFSLGIFNNEDGGFVDVLELELVDIVIFITVRSNDKVHFAVVGDAEDPEVVSFHVVDLFLEFVADFDEGESLFAFEEIHVGGFGLFL